MVKHHLQRQLHSKSPSLNHHMVAKQSRAPHKSPLVNPYKLTKSPPLLKKSTMPRVKQDRERVCVCVCVWERERERERDKKEKGQGDLFRIDTYCMKEIRGLGVYQGWVGFEPTRPMLNLSSF